MKRLIKKSEIYNGMNIGDDYYEVFRNPTDREISDTNRQSHNVGIRGIMCLNGDVYIWPYDLLHSKAIRMANIPDEMHFAFEYGTMTVFLKPGEDVQKLVNTIKACQSNLSKLGVKNSTKLQVDSSYYSSKKYQFYDYVETVDDIYSVTDSQMQLISAAKIK